MKGYQRQMMRATNMQNKQKRLQRTIDLQSYCHCQALQALEDLQKKRQLMISGGGIGQDDELAWRPGASKVLRGIQGYKRYRLGIVNNSVR